MFSSALLFPAAPTSGAGGICPELDTKSRHLNHKVMNLTRHPITLVLANLESGRWSSQLPKPTIHAFSSASHCTCNRNNEVTGTTGSYVYRLALPTQSRPQSQHPHPEAVFYIACFFSNPLMGAFKAAIKVYGHEPSLTLLLADYSLISTSRTDVTFGTDNVNLFTAVSVPGSQVVFEIREQNHVGAGAPLLPPPCRWAGISFPGDEPWPAHFVFRGVLAAAQQPHIRRAVPSVGPRRLSAQYHLSVATINFEQLPRGVDIADAVSQMLATVNVVVLVNALEAWRPRPWRRCRHEGSRRSIMRTCSSFASSQSSSTKSLHFAQRKPSSPTTQRLFCSSVSSSRTAARSH
ncbi:hypothetical protein BCR44DRAFT_1026504 [Catenaria anguillulae PL171]|uniref:Uncharacterized protein n=1 Tax=Catenaria anguillulae PL171 TaxID=765915 RepID=A0A1Y2HVR0_9FUNG|nr:hypothetical protein BCR44DRAFT_1026504 [Catenaria anguillulae PL171]